jgi:hypothetical protein
LDLGKFGGIWRAVDADSGKLMAVIKTGRVKAILVACIEARLPHLMCTELI